VLSSQEKGIPAMKQVSQTSQQMLRMVMDILDIQKLESPELQLHIETKKLYEIVQEVVSQISFLAEEKLIQVQNLIPEDATVEADTALLTRVFENLLTNAIKYSPIEGSVKIQVRPVAEALIEISISDTGKGMPADKLSGIFDKFSQIEAKNSGKIRSTGLGLAFCKLAIEAHQGKIWAESELGKGSIFKFIMNGSVEDGDLYTQEIVKQPLVYTEADKALIRQMQQAISQFSLYQGAAILEKTQSFVLQVTENAGAKHWLDELHAVLLHYDEERFEQLKNHP
jgi:K+-sensing histidine kinase KdpD